MSSSNELCEELAKMVKNSKGISDRQQEHIRALSNEVFRLKDFIQVLTLRLSLCEKNLQIKR